MKGLVLLFYFLAVIRPSIAQDFSEESSLSTTQEMPPVVIENDLTQTNKLQDEYQNQPLDNSKNNNWQKARDGLKYETDKEKVEKSKKIKDKNESTNSKPRSSFWSGLPAGAGQIIAYTIALSILGFVIYYLLANTLWIKSKNQKIKIESTHHEIDLDEVEFPELQMLLKNALNSGDFRQAIRWQYLLSLKTLTELKFILWKKQKTNHDYMLEMSANPKFNQFSNITLVFEKVWYGNSMVNERFYKEVEPAFNQFLNELKTKGGVV